MRVVIWTDENGYCHRSVIRDTDPDDKAPEIGARSDPPNLDRLDWNKISDQLPDLDIAHFKRKLHNRLVRSGLISWEDVQRSQNGLTAAMIAAGRDRRILSILKRQLVALYRQ